MFIKRFCDESAPTDVLKNILPPNSIFSRFSELDLNILLVELGVYFQSFTKPPLIQEIRLTGGLSPNLVDLVERKVPVEWKMGAANSFHSFYP